MSTLNSVPAHLVQATERFMAGQSELEVDQALRRSLTSEPQLPTPLNPVAQKPLNLLPRNMLLVGEVRTRDRSALALLARWNIAAEVATNGAEAARIASTGEFELILIDAKKSVLDGV